MGGCEEEEHGAACGCTQCQAQAVAKRLALIHQDAERLFHENFPDAKYYPVRDCAADHHAWNKLDLLLNHFRCLPIPKQALLRDVYRRVNYDLPNGKPGYWKRQKAFMNYGLTASIVAMSSYEAQHDFCRCGYHGLSCGDRVLCLRCCFNLLAKPALEEFGNAFQAHAEVYFIVLSLASEPDERQRIIFKDLTKSEMQQIRAQGCFEQRRLTNYGIPFTEPWDALDARIHWDIYADAIHGFTGRGKPLAGAFGGPELAVRFLPLGVLPHANYIGFSEGLTSDDVRALRRSIRQRLRGCRRITHRQYPKVAVYRLGSQQDLREVIKYIYKPIGIAIPYVLSADRLDYRPDGMISLNQDVDMFFDNLGLVFEGLVRMNRYGDCSPSAGEDNYIGTVSHDRLTRRKEDAKRRKAQRRETKGIKAAFPDYRPHKRRKTDQERYDSFLMRAYYRKSLRDGEYPNELCPRPKRLLRRERFRKRPPRAKTASQ